MSKNTFWIDEFNDKCLEEDLGITKIKRCYICRIKERLTVHHKVPRSLGGLDTPENKTDMCLEHHNYLHFVARKSNLDQCPLKMLKLLEDLREEYENDMKKSIKEVIKCPKKKY